MAHLLRSSFNEYFSEGFLTALSVHLDEPRPAVAKAIAATIPTVMSAISVHASANRNKNAALLRKVAGYYPKAPDVEALQNHWKGGQLPDAFFGDNLSAVTTHVAAYSGVRPASAGELIVLVTPVVAGKLGEHGNGDLSLDEIQAHVPEGYIVPDLSRHLQHSKTDQHLLQEENKIRNKTNFVFPRWIPIALIIAAVLLLIYFSRL